MAIASEKSGPCAEGAAVAASIPDLAVHGTARGDTAVAAPVTTPVMETAAPGVSVARPLVTQGAAGAASTPPATTAEPAATLESATIDRWMRRSWTSLAVASFLSTAGMSLALAPLLRSQIETLWPWALTHLSLLAALPCTFLTLVLLLTLRQQRLLSRRRALDRSLQHRVESAGRHAETITHVMQELESEVETQRQVERTLQAVAATLQRQIEEEKCAAERQQQQLAEVKRVAEIQNVRLREQNRLAHEFVSHVSHEFRTPLTVIREYATTMKEELVGDVTPEQYKYLETIISRVDDLIVMVSDVVDISSLEANILVAMRRVCGVDEVVTGPRDVLERKATASGVHLAMQIDPGLPVVFCDPEKVGRVLVNLGINAIKFSESGQAVEVWCRRGANPAEVVIGVTDHGPGVAPEHLERIFRCFEQLDTTTRSSTKGFGLGLTIVRELVHLNFGRVDVQSAVGKGSSFSFTLPVAEPRLLLPLYVERVMATKRAARAVSLLSVCTETGCDAAGHEEIEHYLSRHSRRTDLVIPTAPGRWLIVATTDRAGTDRMLERLARGWSQMDPQTHANLPTLQWRIAGCFDVETRVDDLVRTYVEISQSDPKMVLTRHPLPPKTS